MQKFFLESIANYYIQKYRTVLSSFCFVFPGRRAGLFFRNHLNSQTDTPIWAPEILTINELFEQTDSLITADSITLLFELHKVYNEILGHDIPFDEFISWGEMFLNDFNDIDKHLVPAEQLYSNLSALKELDDDYSHLTENQMNAILSFWGTFNVKKISSDQEKFVNVWDNLNIVYRTFSERLKQKGKAYGGMHYRIVAEKILNKEFPDFTYEKIIFVGFNALTPAEKELFSYLKNSGKADFFWDYSDWILDPHKKSGGIKSDNYGAGFFIDENIRNYPPPPGWSIPVPETNSLPEISIVPVSTSLDQVREINDFLTENYGDDLRTALVLTDENILIPALHGIPGKIEHVNITMGYPLKNTPAYGLTELLYNLQKQLRTGKDGKIWFYHKHIIPILQHQYITLLAPEAGKEFMKNIISQNTLFVEAKEFENDKLFSLIFQKINTSEDISVYLKNIFELIFNKLADETDKIIEREFIYTIYKTITRLEDILWEQKELTDTTTWFRLLKKLLEFQTVPFEGEPLAGLQVMGILETRAIDFENLIILNLNEGIFPRTSPPNTFIPYSLRVGFSLPTIEYQDNIFSYYFFRLIHRAKKISLVYTTETQGNRSGEMSRFLYLLKYLYPVEPEVKNYSEEVKLMQVPPVVTVKTESVRAQLEEFSISADRHLSASSLSNYIECPMKFYYKNVAGIKEPEEISEEADARIFGNIFHQIVEDIYAPHKGKVVNEQDIEAIIKDKNFIDALIKKSFHKNLTGFDYKKSGYADLYGKNMILLEVIKRYIIRLLEKEKSYCPFTVIDLEKQVFWTPTVHGMSIKLKGYIDRIDMKDGITRVIDYKTGKSQNYYAELKDLFNSEKHSKNKAVFQTLLYSHILSQTNEEATYQPGIINIKDLFTDSFSINIRKQKPRQKGMDILLNDVRQEFSQYLQNLLEEIFDPEIPFTQTSETKTCPHCPYKSLCRR